MAAKRMTRFPKLKESSPRPVRLREEHVAIWRPGRTLFRLLIALGLFSLAIHGLTSFVGAPDPSFATAQRLVEDYEQTNPPEARNYEDPVYDETLSLLAEVDPDSPEAPAARKMSDRIRQERDQFQQRLAETEAVYAERRRRRVERRETVFAAQDKAAREPVTEFPECKEDGHDVRRHRHR